MLSTQKLEEIHEVQDYEKYVTTQKEEKKKQIPTNCMTCTGKNPQKALF